MADLIFLASRMPLPPQHGGDAARAWHMLARLAEKNRVHLACFLDHPRDHAHLPALEQICASVLCLPVNHAAQRLRSVAALVQGKPVAMPRARHPRLQRWIEETVSGAGVSRAFISGAAMAYHLEDYRFETRVIDLVEVKAETWRQAADASHWPLNEIFWRQERAHLTAEKNAAARCECALFGSAAEANLFGRRVPRAPARIVALRNGIDHAWFSPSGDYPNPYNKGRRPVVFAGDMDYGPNIEGADWFASEVMTMLRHRFPAIDFWIVGAHVPRALRALEARDIRVASRVTDVRPYLAHADAVVAPLRVGRGIENNVLEGMAMAKPVVATPVAVDGLELVNGDEVFSAASAPGFATGVAAVLSGRAPKMGAKARQRVEADFGWPATLKLLDEIFAEGEAARAGAS